MMVQRLCHEQTRGDLLQPFWPVIGARNWPGSAEAAASKELAKIGGMTPAGGIELERHVRGISPPNILYTDLALRISLHDDAALGALKEHHQIDRAHRAYEGWR